MSRVFTCYFSRAAPTSSRAAKRKKGTYVEKWALPPCVVSNCDSLAYLPATMIAHWRVAPA